MRHRAGLLVAGLLLAVAAAPAAAGGAAAGAFGDGDYWRVADALAAALDHQWDAARGAYVDLSDGPTTRHNANLLLVHAIAAERGHGGPSRRDDRARALVRRLTEPVATRPGGRGPADRHLHDAGWCWTTRLGRWSTGEKTLEPKVAEALAQAWRARRALALSPRSVAAIARLVDRCARSRAWRYPEVKGNQVNWNADLYAAAATVTGRADLLRGDYRRLLARFAAGITRPAGGARAPNLGPGYAFHYAPRASPRAAVNLDSAEYATIVGHALIHYERALRAGMRPLPARSIRLLRAWTSRILAGYWTHAGYLNWDTGLGFRRWHSVQYWAFGQQGLLAIATAPRFAGDRRHPRWAKAILDRGLGLYGVLARERGEDVAPGELFGTVGGFRNRYVAASRVAANAARAVALGLGSAPAADPPPLYAFDADIGRLAVTTPRYSTAILATNRGAFPYGGLEPARLLGSRLQVVAGIGGTPPGSFGVVVTDRGGRELLATQRARRLQGGRPPLRLVDPRTRRELRPRPYPRRPYAGPFDVLEARGAVASRGVSVRVAHRFGARTIETRWLVRSDGRAALRVRAHFPTWGKASVVDVIRRDGSVLRLAGPGATGAAVRLGEVARVRLGAAAGGYRLLPSAGSRDATLVALPGRPQPSNPSPGPTLAIELASAERFHERELAVRVVPEP